eukprot:4789858-Amphidinium_carterae.1
MKNQQVSFHAATAIILRNFFPSKYDGTVEGPQRFKEAGCIWGYLGPIMFSPSPSAHPRSSDYSGGRSLKDSQTRSFVKIESQIICKDDDFWSGRT